MKNVKYLNPVLGLAVGLGLLVVPFAANGQLVVESSSLQNGDTDVDTVLTIEVTFSTALDTTADFPEPGELYLGLLVPEGTESNGPDSVSISPDFRTVRFHDIHLEENSRYHFGVLAARSQYGDLLDLPWVVTFTTADTLPTGSISGTLSYPDGHPQGALVALTTHFLSKSIFSGIAVVNSATGEYTIPYVEAGDFYSIAIKDETGNGDLGPFGGSPFGFYDPDQDKRPDAVRLESGQHLPAVDIELEKSLPVTARALAPAARDLARETLADAVLSSVMGPELGPDGRGNMWMYMFVSESVDTSTAVIGTSLFFMDMQDLGDGDDYDYDDYDDGDDDYDDGYDDEPPMGGLPLPDNWIDSDVALDSANANGGREFMDVHPDADISAFLMSLVLEPGEMPRLKFWGGDKIKNRVSPGSKIQGITRSIFQDADTLTIWVVDFWANGGYDEKLVVIDAITGKEVNLFPEGNATTARYNMDALGPIVRAWASDAYLVNVTSHSFPVDPDGLAEMWGYIYYSADHDSASLFIMAEGFLMFQGGLGWPLNSKMPLPDDWIDSGAAKAVSEANGGSGFRQDHADGYAAGSLGTGLWPFDLNRAAWQFDYFTYQYEPGLKNYVDALSGELLTAGNAVQHDWKSPGEFSLGQNFPNPFNPETRIEYSLPEAAHVKISVINLNGQEVAALVSENKVPGRFHVTWNGCGDNGRPVPSGVYFYRIKAGKFSAVKKMLHMR